MKKLSFWNKLVFLLNSLFAVLLLVSYILPYFPPKIFPPLSVLTLVIPVLIAANILFVIYWLLLLKKQLLLSALVLIIWFFQGSTLYKLSSGIAPDQIVKTQRQLKIFSYNAHVFRNEIFSSEEIKNGVLDLIGKTNPDIICFQEFSKHGAPQLDYPYSYFGEKDGKHANVQAIYSKYKIVKAGSLEFESTFNNALFADIVKDNDTLRIYNMHMQSLALTPELGALEKENTKSLIGRLGRSFKKQQEQTNLFLTHEKNCRYKKIVAGDFNNTVFSYTYHKIRGEKKDAFVEKGSGFGQTFIFDIIPLRIDFILPDPQIEVAAFKTFDVEYSDHFPIEAVLNL
ncbi:endonuclease/exonuclease/phosphatase family protein [Leeuwenhoekiella marinoflava]|uniref:endonuclease/exonuclease/phosphatase family protein n=1 Tax=Leeuwenhoekiella marinoflava TaxID=988 RepID=UPI003001A928